MRWVKSLIINDCDGATAVLTPQGVLEQRAIRNWGDQSDSYRHKHLHRHHAAFTS